MFLWLALATGSKLAMLSISIEVAEFSFVADLVCANEAYGSELTVGSLVAERV